MSENPDRLRIQEYFWSLYSKEANMSLVEELMDQDLGESQRADVYEMLVGLKEGQQDWPEEAYKQAGPLLKIEMRRMFFVGLPHKDEF